MTMGDTEDQDKIQYEDISKKLINLVKTYPQLWDLDHHDYYNSAEKSRIWKTIAEDMGGPVKTVKEKWYTLRTRYKKALKLREDPHCVTHQKWHHEDDLSFLDEHIKEMDAHLAARQKLTNKESDETETVDAAEETNEYYSPFEDTSEEFVDLGEGSNDNYSPLHEEVDLDPFEETQMTSVTETKDELDSTSRFFLSLAETVITLPPIVQAKVKGEVFKCVNAAEVSFLEASANCECHNAGQS